MLTQICSILGGKLSKLIPEIGDQDILIQNVHPSTSRLLFRDWGVLGFFFPLVNSATESLEAFKKNCWKLKNLNAYCVLFSKYLFSSYQYSSLFFHVVCCRCTISLFLVSTKHYRLSSMKNAYFLFSCLWLLLQYGIGRWLSSFKIYSHLLKYFDVYQNI